MYIQNANTRVRDLILHGTELHAHRSLDLYYLHPMQGCKVGTIQG